MSELIDAAGDPIPSWWTGPSASEPWPPEPPDEPAPTPEPSPEPGPAPNFPARFVPVSPGSVVTYVGEDGAPREALVLLADGESLALLVQVATSPDDPVQRRQFAPVHFDARGAPGTWRHAPGS